MREHLQFTLRNSILIPIQTGVLIGQLDNFAQSCFKLCTVVTLNKHWRQQREFILSFVRKIFNSLFNLQFLVLFYNVLKLQVSQF